MRWCGVRFVIKSQKVKMVKEEKAGKPSKTMSSVIAIGRIVWYTSIFLSVVFLICFLAIPYKYDSEGVVVRDNTWAFICFSVSFGIAIFGAAMWDGIDGGTNYDNLDRRVTELEEGYKEIKEKLSIRKKD